MTSLLALAAGADSALGQIPVPGGMLSGQVELGGRTYADEPRPTAIGKFEEYRDVSSGFYVPLADLVFTSTDERYFVELGGFRAGRDDQRLWLNAYRPGSFNALIAWDELPHVYSTTGRLLTPSSPRGVFPLPSPRPPLPDHNNAPRLDDIDVRWNTGRAAVRVTPTPDWDLRAEYNRIDKEGDRPIGMAFGSPGNNMREILEPVDQVVHDVRLTQGYASAKYQVQLAYNLSVFDNEFEAVVADNPSVSLDTPAAGSSRGRDALWPSNLAHTFSLSGGVTLPMRSRVSAIVSYGIRRQDEPFLPFTINTAITVPDSLAGLLTLPRDRLDGDVRTLLLNVTGSTSPARAMTVTARYRLYDYDDHTEDFSIAGRVLNDRTLQVEEFDSHRFAFQRHNAGVDLRWQPVRPASLKLSYGWEHWDRARQLRDVESTTEHTPRVTLDVTPRDWLLLRAAYAHSWRDVGNYEAVTEEQLPLLRKFDEADRERDRAEFLAQITPLDQLAFSASYGLGNDDYTDSRYGLQENENWTASADVTFSPHERVSLFAGYTWEDYHLQQRSRYREPDQLDNLTFDWVGRVADELDTVRLGFDASVLPAKLDVGSSWNYSFATSKMLASNPLTPAGGTEAQRTNATAVDFPTLRNLYSAFEAFLRYHPLARWTATFGYTYEHFKEKDFRTDGLPPNIGADIILANDWLDYSAHYLTFFVSYDLGALAVGTELP
ncbi:MAG TPA: MtrB/PioB family decaheme-associated outer membrane protein [Gemmatimonadota bacterium]